MIGPKDIFELIQALVWPIVVLVAIVAFRRPFSNLLQKATTNFQTVKVSILQFSLELSQASEFKPTWIVDQFGSDLRQLTPADHPLSEAAALFEEFKGDKHLDYLIIDLGTGDRWLTSRLFIFAIMLERMRGLRCLVFLETRDNVDHRFLGIASPSGVRWALARRYPWLETAFADAYAKATSQEPEDQKIPTHRIRSDFGALDSSVAKALVHKFLENIQQDKLPNPDDGIWETWKTKEGQQLWEHARSLDAMCLKQDLGDILQQDAYTWLKVGPDIPRTEQAQSILRRKKVSFVALVNEEKRFESLIDREDFLERVAARLGIISEDNSSIT